MRITWVKTDKFKDIICSLRFSKEVNLKEYIARSILAYMISDRCLKYDTKVKMNQVMDELYSVALSANLFNYGYRNTLEFKIRFLKANFINDDQYLNDVFAFFHEIIFHPLLTPEVFHENKKLLINKAQRLYDDFASFALYEGLKRCGKGYPLEIIASITKENIEAISLDDVKKAYQSLFIDNVADMLVCANREDPTMNSMIIKYFPISDKQIDIPSYYMINNHYHKEYYLKRDTPQSEIVLFYFTHIMVGDDDYWALQVANALLGRYSSSLLFQEVREKQSLCYSISSRLISADSILYLTTSIDSCNISKAIEAMKQQIEVIKQANFSDDLLSTIKKLLINSYQAGNDQSSILISRAYNRLINQRNLTDDDYLKAIEKVSKNDVVKVMNKVSYEMSIIVTSEANQDEK